ncbi:LD-carboxypeptidase [Lactobacillus sp. YT155]|uniref:S66 family peptidase n=1 Tax=Lactobacillus sp. YT155 TaxID=3060955 RepID=UPI0026603ECF|nr:S66 peptidase family protein [Lactobacillus sp. YT155]MDO1605045.1 LD-carboxypeptidase [Lactobacillus sp. YT155]
MIKPKKLQKGDKVAIVSLSSGILGGSEFQLKLGIDALKSFDLEPVLMKNATKGIDYLWNHPEARAQDLKAAFLNDSIKGIICAIGGIDTYKTVPFLLEDDEFVNAVKTHPKLFTGFSDTTINHLMFYKLGMKTFYGPNFLNDLAELPENILSYTKLNFENYFSDANSFEIKSSDTWFEERIEFDQASLETPRVKHKEEHGYLVLRGQGKAQGELIGGCLESLYSLVSPIDFPNESAVSNKYELFPSADKWQDKILFIETSEDKPDAAEYRKMLRGLFATGILEKISGILVGKPQNEIGFDEYQKILVEETKETNTPILYNVNFGHAYPHAVIPYGAKAEIDFDNRKVKIVESFFDK